MGSPADEDDSERRGLRRPERIFVYLMLLLILLFTVWDWILDRP